MSTISDATLTDHSYSNTTVVPAVPTVDITKKKRHSFRSLVPDIFRRNGQKSTASTRECSELSLTLSPSNSFEEILNNEDDEFLSGALESLGSLDDAAAWFDGFETEKKKEPEPQNQTQLRVALDEGHVVYEKYRYRTTKERYSDGHEESDDQSEEDDDHSDYSDDVSHKRYEEEGSEEEWFAHESKVKDEEETDDESNYMNGRRSIARQASF